MEDDELGVFMGFELYYKLYEPGDDELETDLLDRSSLQPSRGYYRITSSEDSPGNHRMPLIFIPSADRNDDFVVTIDFESRFPNNPEITSTVLASPVQIFRGIPDDEPGSEDEFKSFTDFVTGDDDLPAAIEDVPQASRLTMDMVIYILSFGRDEIHQPVYSYAVPLVFSNIPFPTGS